MKQPFPPSITRRFNSPAAGRKGAGSATAPAPFSAFIAYADLPAAKRAMKVINEVLFATSGKFSLNPMLWRFDQLANAKWRDYAIDEARGASVIVLASSSRGPLPPALEAWVAALLSRKRGERLTIVSLHGEEDAWTISIEAPQAPARAQPSLRALPDAEVATPIAA